nr:immunoglobulin heavy chain junction region [Mus musculus]
YCSRDNFDYDWYFDV